MMSQDEFMRHACPEQPDQQPQGLAWEAMERVDLPAEQRNTASAWYQIGYQAAEAKYAELVGMMPIIEILLRSPMTE